MRVGVLGVNFKTSPLSLRERLAKACHCAFSPNAIAQRLHGVVLLSTCNRTEIYFSAEDLAECHSNILAILRNFVDAPFEQALYSFFGQDCFLHLAKVASGLDSAIVAETEIQQQVRLAYGASSRAYILDSALHFLFQKSLKISKAVRFQFPLPRGLASLESTIAEIVLNSSMKEILLIGNSQINRQLVNTFQRRKKFSLTMCTRSIEGAEEYAKERCIGLVDWNFLSEWEEWGIVICATQHPGYLISKPPRIAKSHLLIDLSVPRLINPALACNPYLHLLNMEQIASLVDGRRRSLLKQVNDSQFLVEDLVEKSTLQYRQKDFKILHGLT